MNEHIEYFKRFAACYLMYSHSDMDRIVAETVKKHDRPFPSYKEMFPSPPTTLAMFAGITKRAIEGWRYRPNLFLNAIHNQLPGDKDIKIGTTQLRIRLPSDYRPSR